MASRYDAVDRARKIPIPYRDPQAWNVVFGGFKVDHRVVQVTLKGLKTVMKHDTAEPNGVDGGTLKHGGRKLASFDLELRCGWSEPGFLAVNTLVLMANDQSAGAARRGTVEAIGVYHPILAEALKSSTPAAVYVHEIDWPEWVGQFYVATIHCKQWAPAPKSQKTKPVSTTLFGAVPDVFLAHDAVKNPPKPPPPSAAKKAL